MAVSLLGLVAVACGDDNGDAVDSTPSAGVSTVTPASGTPAVFGTPKVPPSTGGTAGGPSPTLLGPSSRYAPSETDLEGLFALAPADTISSSPEVYAQVGPFVNAAEGLQRAKDWGYAEGFVVGFDPEGLLSAVVQGQYYTTVQVHLFESVQGAQQAYKQYEVFYKATPGVDAQQLKQLGNESSGWRAIGQKLEPSTLDAVYHRFVFRRGNIVSQVETLGALPFMTADQAREIARIIDERILGERAAPIPTPAAVPGQPSAPR